MKKKYLVVVVAISICIASCFSEKENIILVEEPNDAYDALKVELAQYTAEYNAENGVVLSRAGFWKRLRGFLFADAGGALMGASLGGWGALFGAIYSSAVAGPVYSAIDDEYQEIIPVRPIEPIAPTDSLVMPLYDISTPEEPIEGEWGNIRSYVTVTSTGTGYLHNMILSKINETHPDVLIHVESPNLIAEYVADEMEDEYGYVIPDASKNLLIQKVDSMSMVDIDWEYDDIVTYVNSLAPEYSNEFAIIEDFVANVEPLGGRVAAVQNYLSGYLQIINSSNLTDEQKQLLITSIEVAANSAVLWVVE